MAPTTKSAAVTIDFDAQRKERHRLQAPITFKLGGELFSVRKEVRPEVIARAEELEADSTAREMIELFDDTILEFIDPKGEAHERYRKVRDNARDPIGVLDLILVCTSLVQHYTDRPTVPSESSSRGRGRNGTRSTGGSRSAGRKR